jgi:hypothetical protein
MTEIPEKPHKLKCETCGREGFIRNVLDENGEFVRCECTEGIYIIGIEGHSVPVCGKCKNLMDAVGTSGGNDYCPKCESCEVQRSGYATRKGGKVKRFVCKDCGHVWVDKTKEEAPC